MGFSFSFGKSKSKSKSKQTPIAPWLLPKTEGLLSNLQSGADRMAGMGGPRVGAMDVDLSNLPAVPDEDALFKQNASRYLDALRPGMAARGLLTSGVSQAAEQQGLEGLATTFGERAFERNMTRNTNAFEQAMGREKERFAQEMGASQFSAANQQAYLQALQEAMRSILGQQVLGSSKGSSSSFNVGGAS